MKTKIIVSVKGGIVQAAYADNKDTELILFDWDNIEQEDAAIDPGYIKEQEKQFDNLISSLVEIDVQ